MDTIDSKIMEKLMTNARLTWADLAAEIGLSAPAIAERVQRLVKKRVLKGFSAIVDPERVGCACTAFIAVILERPEHRSPFLQRVQEVKEVQECHHIAGDYDYLLKVRCRDIKDLDRIIQRELKSLPGVLRTKTTVVLHTHKETPQIPLYLA